MSASEWTPEQRQNLSAAIWSGFSAVMFVTDPANWPAFALMARKAQPGTTWTELDRLSMRRDASILKILAEGTDR